MRAGLIAAAVLISLSGCVSTTQTGGEGATIRINTTCAPVPGFRSICGPVATEDLVQVPGTDWLIGSGLDVGAGGHLYLIDAARLDAFVVTPTVGAGSSECSSAPDLAAISISGLVLRDGGNGESRLYAVNHGGRKAIEIFDVESRGQRRPLIRWRDCVPLPGDVAPNAVAVFPDGSLVISSFRDEADPDSWGKLDRGEAQGAVLAWDRPNGLHRLDLGQLSGPNGVAASADGKLLYVSDWGHRRVLVVDRSSHRLVRSIPLPFLPDNIHLAADGRLLVAGQTSTPAAIGACNGPSCPQPWAVVAINPTSGAVEELASGPGSEQVSYAASAIMAAGRTFITVRSDGRILVLDTPAEQ